jgi:spore germination cell wall hydrolase CwlJ-like protein
MIFGNLPSSAQATTLRSNAQGGYLSGQNDLSCLALTIYFEARGEPLDGKLAVGHVVINRRADESFPDRICEVVKQGGEDKLYSCQFSWWCDGLSDKPVEAEAWKESIALAKRILVDAHPDPTRGALWYHADMVNPSWSQKLKKGPTIGRHIFYLDVRNPPIFTRQQLAKGQLAEY